MQGSLRAPRFLHSAGPPRPSRPARRFVSLALAAILALLLTSCAPAPIASWAPPSLVPVPGVALVAVQPPGEGEDGGESPAILDPPASALGAGAAAPDPAALGLMPGRLRNDSLGLAARFVYVPGAPAFNEWMNTRLWDEIAASGDAYEPQVHPVEAGLSDRGCVAGSAAWSAAEVLARPETGPAAGTGVAIVCDITGAFGELLELRLRTVAGSADAVTRDETTLLYVDVSTGETFELTERWSETAPGELWSAVVELLRREAGALSTAPLEPPGEAQLALASAALERAGPRSAEGLLLELPAGIASPELAGLGIVSTEQPTPVLIDAATVSGWASERYRALRESAQAPFAGVRAAASSVPIDCALIPCVALTYDDGPSDFTPLLLDTLAAQQARATFFMVGGYAVNHPELVSRVAAEGHELASHTMNHKNLLTIPLPEARAQVIDAAKVLTNITGRPVTIFRPPYGEVNAEIIREVGLPAILWSIDTNDWRKPGQQALFERAALGARRGDIILFHDTHLDTVQAADAVIRGLRDRGFETVTVTQLFGGTVPLGRVSRA